MTTERELKDTAKAAHDTLSAAYYAKTPVEQAASKAKFDLEHGQIWDGLDAELITGGYKQVPVLPRDLKAEIDELRAEITEMRKNA